MSSKSFVENNIYCLNLKKNKLCCFLAETNKSCINCCNLINFIKNDNSIMTNAYNSDYKNYQLNKNIISTVYEKINNNISDNSDNSDELKTEIYSYCNSAIGKNNIITYLLALSGFSIISSNCNNKNTEISEISFEKPSEEENKAFAQYLTEYNTTAIDFTAAAAATD